MKLNILLNGHATSLEGVLTIQDLIRHLGYGDKRIAVERNGSIVPKSAHETTKLTENDEIEVVIAVGGG